MRFASAIAAPMTLGSSCALFAACARDDRSAEVETSLRELRGSGLVPQTAAAVRLGRLYRDRHPGEGSANELCRELAGERTPTTAEEWRRLAAQSLARDRELRREVELDGWIVTPTEARLLAVASLR